MSEKGEPDSCNCDNWLPPPPPLLLLLLLLLLLFFFSSSFYIMSFPATKLSLISLIPSPFFVLCDIFLNLRSHHDHHLPPGVLFHIMLQIFPGDFILVCSYNMSVTSYSVINNLHIYFLSCLHSPTVMCTYSAKYCSHSLQISQL